MHYVAVFTDVGFTFDAQFASFFGAGFTVTGDKVVELHHLSADKTIFEVGVDHACGLWGCGANRNSPGAHFFYTSSEVGVQV